jgi:hypothetical protein
LASALITEHLLIKLREVLIQAHIQVFQDTLHLLLKGILHFPRIGNEKLIDCCFHWREAFLANEFGRAEVRGS